MAVVTVAATATAQMSGNGSLLTLLTLMAGPVQAPVADAAWAWVGITTPASAPAASFPRLAKAAALPLDLPLASNPVAAVYKRTCPTCPLLGRAQRPLLPPLRLRLSRVVLVVRRHAALGLRPLLWLLLSLCRRRRHRLHSRRRHHHRRSCYLLQGTGMGMLQPSRLPSHPLAPARLAVARQLALEGLVGLVDLVQLHPVCSLPRLLLQMRLRLCIGDWHLRLSCKGKAKGKGKGKVKVKVKAMRCVDRRRS